MELNAIIVDDEKMARTLLRGYIAEFCPNVTVLEECADLPNGVKAIRKHQPDIVFLDIEMPGHSGLELLEFFDPKDVSFSIIFTTAYNQYALQAFKLSAIDYILKPIEPTELVQAIERFVANQSKRDYNLLKENLAPQTIKKIAVPQGNTIKYIPIEDILFFKAEGAYTHIQLADHSKLLASKGLKYYDELLSDYTQFYRTHKSFLVNIHHVSEHVKSEGGYLKMGEFEVGITSDKVEGFQRLMQR